MQHTNIISAYQGVISLDEHNVKSDKKLNLGLRAAEARTLSKLCETLKKYNSDFSIFDGYYIGYIIKQIGKEFDLLRLSNDTVINIELKAPLDDDIKFDKINAQMHKNYYYLKFLGKKILIFTYIENDGIYKYNPENNDCELISFEDLSTILCAQKFDDKTNPDELFVPSNYLISPFNHTDNFINNEYFLTDAQSKIKKQIINSTNAKNYEYFCIPANAGTGKTLLLYDVAKTLLAELGSSSVLIIHCGKLNEGHLKLVNNYNWNIISIAKITERCISTLINENIKIILIDESQRINHFQLDMIICLSKKFNIPIIFAYDKKQYLRHSETLDLFEYIQEKNTDIPVTKKELTNKIRTNKEMASFVTNLFHIGKSNCNLNYNAVTIDYLSTVNEVQGYIAYLEKNKGFKAINYTPSRYIYSSRDKFTDMCSSNAHEVIGQEFDKVVLVMDKSFWYDKSNTLCANGNYYSALGMLYQIVTRVVNELKIVVLNNPKLYGKLLEIKSMDEE